MSNPGARILVVGDDPYVRLCVLQALQQEPSYAILEATSKAEALALHHKHRFDLVLADIQMEHVAAGVDLLAAVKRHSPDTLGILLTAYAALDTAIAAVRAHADDYLLKPIPIASLRSSVTSALAGSRQQKAARTALQPSTPAVDPLHRAAGSSASVASLPAKVIPPDQYLTCGAITIDLHRYDALIGSGSVDLTATEFAIIRSLFLAHGGTVTFEHLVMDVYQEHLDRDNARTLLASHVRNLRRKLGAAAAQIVNVQGIGYYLTAAMAGDRDAT